MEWITIRVLLGAAALVFGVLLLVLPGLRIQQRRLTIDDVAGLLIAGVGFLLLAAAALLARDVQAQQAIVMGVFMIVAGNIWQRVIDRRKRNR
jgi:hypothetical protein